VSNRILCGLFGALAALAVASSAFAAAPRPNLVFILADDLGYGDLASYGHPRIRTPHLDRLAADGTRYLQYYSNSVCSPSRAALLTGQFPSRWQVYAHFAWLSENAKRGMPDWLDVRAPSFPRLLQQAGYHTAIFGKWHLGGGSGRTYAGKAINSADAPPPTAYGYHESRVFVGNGPNWRGTAPVEESHDTYVVEDGPFLAASSRVIADAALAYLERSQRERPGQPFLLNVHFHDPHVPLRPTPAMLAPYSDIDDIGVRAYYAVVTEMDAQIGRLLARLAELGLSQNTLVVFTSDNGTPARPPARNARRLSDTDTAGSNGPLRGWKWHLYEGGIRVPLIVRRPGVVPAGRVDATSVLNVCDFAPTFARLAGATLPADYRPDGVDASAALRGAPFTRAAPLFWHHPTATRRGPILALRAGDWKLLMEPDGTDAQLFNLAADPGEECNLARTEPARLDALRAQLRTWAGTLPRPLDRVHERPGPHSPPAYIPSR
jgi:arylsulfatase A-like enzyme